MASVVFKKKMMNQETMVPTKVNCNSAQQPELSGTRWKCLIGQSQAVVPLANDASLSSLPRAASLLTQCHGYRRLYFYHRIAPPSDQATGWLASQRTLAAPYGAGR